MISMFSFSYLFLNSRSQAKSFDYVQNQLISVVLIGFILFNSWAFKAQFCLTLIGYSNINSINYQLNGDKCPGIFLHGPTFWHINGKFGVYIKQCSHNMYGRWYENYSCARLGKGEYPPETGKALKKNGVSLGENDKIFTIQFSFEMFKYTHTFKHFLENSKSSRIIAQICKVCCNVSWFHVDLLKFSRNTWKVNKIHA